MRVITNLVPRDIIYGYELSEDERKEFDYIDFETDVGQFVKYKKEIYDLSEFMAVQYPREIKDFAGWDGIQTDTHFSGILVRYVKDDNEQVIMGRYYT